MGSRFPPLFSLCLPCFPVPCVPASVSLVSVLSRVSLAVPIQLISPGLFHFTPSDCISSPVPHQLTSLRCLKPDSRPNSHSLPDWSVYVVQALRPSSAFATLFFFFFCTFQKLNISCAPGPNLIQLTAPHHLNPLIRLCLYNKTLFISSKASPLLLGPDTFAQNTL